MKTAAKTTLNSMEEVLHEINTLVELKEQEEFARIFIKRSNLSLTYDSNDCMEIINISATHSMRAISWNVDFNL